MSALREALKIYHGSTGMVVPDYTIDDVSPEILRVWEKHEIATEKPYITIEENQLRHESVKSDSESRFSEFMKSYNCFLVSVVVTIFATVVFSSLSILSSFDATPDSKINLGFTVGFVLSLLSLFFLREPTRLPIVGEKIRKKYNLDSANELESLHVYNIGEWESALGTAHKKLADTAIHLVSEIYDSPAWETQSLRNNGFKREDLHDVLRTIMRDLFDLWQLQEDAREIGANVSENTNEVLESVSETILSLKDFLAELRETEKMLEKTRNFNTISMVEDRFALLRSRVKTHSFSEEISSASSDVKLFKECLSDAFELR